MENEKVMQYLEQAESAAEQVLTDRAQIVELDRSRNKLREASRALRKNATSTPKTSKHWVCVGGTFVKMPSETISKIVENDMKELDSDISKLRTGLKEKVNKLRDVEDKDELRGFNLNPLSSAEMKAIENVL